ncbi:MAG: class B sortase [Coriobacteriia bacterium]|nr:class B sortase [Coriobacteriia bacterium]
MAADQARTPRGGRKDDHQRSQARDEARGREKARVAGGTRRPKTTSELQASLEARRQSRGAAPGVGSGAEVRAALAAKRLKERQGDEQPGAKPGGSGTRRGSKPGSKPGAGQDAKPGAKPGAGQEGKPPKKKGRVALILGVVFLVIALVIAGFLVYRYMSAGAKTRSTQQAAEMEVKDLEHLKPDTKLDAIRINWDALREINPDVVGWVIIPDTRVNYPIVQGEDNDYYLNHLFDGTYNDSGAIFLDFLNDPAIRGKNNFIYGHNLLDGSMFASLKAWREQEYFDAHRVIILATPEMNYRLEVVACLVCDGDDRIRRFEFIDNEDFEDYVGMLLGYAVLSELNQGEIPDKIYCFVTCTDTNYAKRTILLARLDEQKAPEGAETT